MEHLAPRFIDEAESKKLGILHGWYGTRVSGTLMTGPCSTDDECLQKISQLPEPAATATRSMADCVWSESDSKSKSPPKSSGHSVKTLYELAISSPANRKRDRWSKKRTAAGQK
jgi:hypothetical protein